MILLTHPGPVRRLFLDGPIYDFLLEYPKLDKLQELEMCIHGWDNPLPDSVFRFAPTIRVLSLTFGIRFPKEIPNALHFPELKNLTITSCKISEHVLNGILSGCPVLENLLLEGNHGYRHLRICPMTLRSLVVSDSYTCPEENIEVIIEDAPLLERLIPSIYYGLIRVIQAPNLKTLGYLRGRIFKFELGTMVFEKMVPVVLSNEIRSVKILALFNPPNLDAVTGFLKCFPCVEKLYIAIYKQMAFMNAQQYSPLECLDQHLKKMQIINYEKSAVNFIRFFILNARVLESMKFVVHQSNYDPHWIASQLKKLQVSGRASRAARFDFEANFDYSYSLVHWKHVHDLATDPFDGSS